MVVERDRSGTPPRTVKRAPVKPPPPKPAGDVQDILRLQSVAGNAAVGELLAAGKAPGSAGPDTGAPPVPPRSQPPAEPPPPPPPPPPPAAQLTDLATGDHPPTA